MMPFTIFNEGKNDYPIIISLPHSGTWIPEDMRESLRQEAVLANTDWFLPELYNFLVAEGCTVIENHINRYTVDPNRESRMSGADYQDTVVYQQNTFGNPLYEQPLSKQTINQRLTQYYWPYHQALQALIDQKKQHFSQVYLFDLHSFAEYPNGDETKPADFVIGNQADRTTSAGLRELVAGLLEKEGYSVSNNHPFSGGFITRHYGQQAEVAALQLEIRYNRYIEQRSFGEEELTGCEPKLFFEAQARLQRIFEDLLAVLPAKKHE
ncbi:N-formylglutamate amidohydrolase [Candidatus Enterococcus murrayae]|uniref:N-formylglutamate amidohydrolase n=1 Tax=Candidatus Enterococcus murrayae TaxID=2815321 RepID=A0ABS3HEY6_9ENTE|nr:N-formylglutamate amidohydrolase [Enterococcus sp. MJM16]MBO0451485.1 N-formylglutamate amidohydrolase [Enterococcus sp. MJM16]